MAHEPDLYAIALVRLRDRVDEILRVLYRMAVHRCDDVSGFESGFLRGGTVLDVDDERAAIPLEVLCKILVHVHHSNAEEGGGGTHAELAELTHRGGRGAFVPGGSVALFQRLQAPPLLHARRSLAQLHLELARLAVACDLDAKLVARLVAADEADQLVGVRHLITVDGDDDVAVADAGIFGWALVDHLAHERAVRVLEVEAFRDVARQLLQVDAEPGVSLLVVHGDRLGPIARS